MATDNRPKYRIGDYVRVSRVAGGRFVGHIVERMFDEGSWYYSIDRKNLLHEPMIEKVEKATNGE